MSQATLFKEVKRISLRKQKKNEFFFSVKNAMNSQARMNKESNKMKDLDVSCGQLSTLPALPNKRIVSTPRKKGEVKVNVNFRLSPSELKDLEAIAVHLKVSRSNLITKALDRCKNDGIWRKTAKKSRPSNQNPLPPPALVALSNALLEYAFVVDSLMKNPSDPKCAEQASRIFLDAQMSFTTLRNEMGC